MKITYKIKNKLKRNLFIARLVSIYRSRELRYKLKKNEKFFFKKITENNIEYKKNIALENFVNKIKKKNFTFPVGRRINILWIGTDENQDKSGFLQSLSKLTNVIEFIGVHGKYGQEFPFSNFDEEVLRRNEEAFISTVNKCLAENSVDIIFGQMLSNFMPKSALDYASSKNIPIVNISMDDRLPHLWEYKNNIIMGAAGYQDAVDLTLTTCSDMCERYEYFGMPSLFWPLASDPDVFYPREVKTIDVSFIGNKYGVREKIVQYLIKSGINVTAYGAGWSNGRIDHKKAPEIFGLSKIILGIGTVGYNEDIYTLKLRDFDAMMSGAAYVTHRNPDLQKLFIEGVDIEYYETLEELKEKIIRLLNAKQKMSEMGKRARSIALAEHTWDIRFSQLLDLLKCEKRYENII